MKRELGIFAGTLCLAVSSCMPGQEREAAASSAVAQHGDTLVDIDGNRYRLVTIGEQVWMAENLRVTRTPEAEEVQSYFFADDSANYEWCGRLYTWGIAMNSATVERAQGICPDGWHVPSDADFRLLFEFVSDSVSAGRALLVDGSSGFDALLCGVADYRGNYLYHGDYGLFWSSTEVTEERAYHHSVEPDGQTGKFAAMKGARIYVRCLKDR